MLLFAAASVNVPSATETEPVPLCVFAVGVNDTVYDVPEPANDDKVPPLTVMSLISKSLASSDNMKVNVDVSPNFNVDGLEAIETVGAVVSTVTVISADSEVTGSGTSKYVVEIALTFLAPPVSSPVSHDHSPVVEFAVQVLPEATPSTYNCTVEPTGAEPVNVSVVAEVLLSVEELPKSSVASRSGVETLGSA